MTEPTSFGFGILGFLVAWVATKFLDRLMLPRITDWWAHLNKIRAANRAEFILKQFENERTQASDGRHLTLVLGNRIAYIVCAVGIFCTLLLVIAIGQILLPEAERTKTINFYLLLLVPAFLFSCFSLCTIQVGDWSLYSLIRINIAMILLSD
jgi:hypothetical protein